MTEEKIDIVTPTGVPIIGIKLNNGKIGKVKCYINKSDETTSWIMAPDPVKSGDKFIFIDNNDKEWALSCFEVSSNYIFSD